MNGLYLDDNEYFELDCNFENENVPYIFWHFVYHVCNCKNYTYSFGNSRLKDSELLAQKAPYDKVLPIP